MSIDQVRDAIVRTCPDAAAIVTERDRVVEDWCRQHGKSKDALEIADVLAIRSLPAWQNAGKAG